MNENIFGIKKINQETEDWNSYKEFFVEKKEKNFKEHSNETNFQKDVRKFENEEEFERNNMFRPNSVSILLEKPKEISNNQNFQRDSYIKKDLSLQNNDKKEENFMGNKNGINKFFESSKKPSFSLSQKTQKTQENDLNIANQQNQADEKIAIELLKQNNKKMDEDYIQNYKKNKDNFTIKQKDWNLLDSIRNNGIPMKNNEVSSEKNVEKISITTNLLEINFEKTIPEMVSIEKPIENFIKNEENFKEKPKENKEQPQKEVFFLLFLDFYVLFYEDL